MIKEERNRKERRGMGEKEEGRERKRQEYRLLGVE